MSIRSYRKPSLNSALESKLRPDDAIALPTSSVVIRLAQKIALWLTQGIVYLKESIDLRSLAAFGLPFLLYLRTLAPTIYNLDSAELTTAAYTGGLVRATGYPLYLSLGYLWARLPLGDVGYRMNLFSALWGALTIYLADRILRHLGVRSWATYGALGLLAVSPFFWGLSLVAEVYTLHTALMAGLILALIRWVESPSPRRLALVSLLGGLGLSHHAATILLVPGSLFYLMITHPKQALAPRSLLVTFVGGLAGLSFLLYLPLRYLAQPSFNYAGTYDADLVFHPVNLVMPSGIWWLISGRAFAGVMMAYPDGSILREIVQFLTSLWRSFFAVGIGPGVLGLVLLFRRNMRLAGMLALMFLCNATFYVNYRVLDKETMYLPTYLVWALWLGLGIQALFDWISEITQSGVRRVGKVLLLGIIAMSVLLVFARNWRITDLSGDWTARQRGEAILSRVEPESLVFGWWDTIPVIQYLQLVEGRRQDVSVINRFLITQQDMAQAIREEVHYRPVYIDKIPGDILPIFKAEPTGFVYQLVLARSESGSDTLQTKQRRR